MWISKDIGKFLFFPDICLVRCCTVWTFVWLWSAFHLCEHTEACFTLWLRDTKSGSLFIILSELSTRRYFKCLQLTPLTAQSLWPLRHLGTRIVCAYNNTLFPIKLSGQRCSCALWLVFYLCGAVLPQLVLRLLSVVSFNFKRHNWGHTEVLI